MRKKTLSWLSEESFNQLPKELRDMKLEYQRLYTKIERREKSLEKRYEKYKMDKTELREWKKERTEKFNKLINLHQTFVPIVSISYSKTHKKWMEVNYSWSITMKYGGKSFSIYIGTDKNVRIRLNELTNSKNYYQDGGGNKFKTRTEKEKQRIQSEVKRFVQPNIVKKLRELNEEFNGFETWCQLYKNKELKGMDFFTDIPKPLS